MLGIRITMNYISKLKRKIRDQDFSVEISFLLTEIGKEETSFISKCPHVYSKIR
jgi:hypothetical protein